MSLWWGRAEVSLGYYKESLVVNDPNYDGFLEKLYVFMIGLGGLDFGHVERRHVDSLVTIVDQMKGSQITGGWGRRRKTIRETIKKY